MGRDLRLLSGGVISMHPRATLGQRVLIMRNVTLGATPDGGVPTIEDDVVIGAGAVVIGSVTIGYGARIAANSLVISDVPANHAAMGVPARHRPLQSRPGPASPAATRTSRVGETGGPST